jgi:hypothetical protein
MGCAAAAAGNARGWAVVDWLWLLLWIAASSAWCVTAAGELGATFDEPLYIARGLEGWRTGSHGGLLRLGTMPLPADLHTAPLHLYETWRGVRFDPDADLARLLPWARAMTLAFWWLLLIYGWRAGWALAGPWGGRFAVALLACEPSLLAHAALATTDIALAACLLALVYHFRTARTARWPRRVAVPTLWFAAALLAKASALVIGPLCLLVVELERRWATGVGGAGRALRDLAWIVGAGLLLVFLFCGSDWQTEPSFVEWAESLPSTAGRAPMLWLAEHLRIFSNAGEALVRQIRHNVRGHGAFLLGREYARAVWYYFPVLLTIKLSEPLLLAPLLIAVVRRRALANWSVLLAAVLVVYSLTFRVQLGIRMVLPIVVFAAVGVAAALADAISSATGGWTRALLGALAAAALAWNVHGALAVWPEGLVYVNRFWGGTADGYRLVSDSNYDWGQGLGDLVRWQRRRGSDALDVWYFGHDPLVDRPPLRSLPLHSMPIAGPDDALAALRGRTVAVSATILYGLDVDSAPFRAALAILRSRPPIDRTTTFFIYDFTGG